MSDTEGYIYPILAPKQLGFSQNLVACYTSSHLYATIAALDKVIETKDVKKIGKSLKEIHAKYGGITELIAVVWRRPNFVPQILEVMPPEYKPKPRTGIMGIGDRRVLQRFKELFREDPSDSCPIEPTPQMIENISKAVGYPVTFGSRFPIGQAFAQIAGAFSQAIEEVNSPSVGLPIQITMITKTGIYSREALIRRSEGVWGRFTARREELALPTNEPTVINQQTDRRTAVQLFP
ncbi:MAG TPA: hypothetical protein VHT73_17935 [Thermodesulfobacteriota bacterium]|nr:hypothetical protein [Thermodesulfobacteriota bacterium]